MGEPEAWTGVCEARGNADLAWGDTPLAWVSTFEAMVDANLAWGHALRLLRHRAKASSAAIEAWFVPGQASRRRGQSRGGSAQASRTSTEARCRLVKATCVSTLARSAAVEARNEAFEAGVGADHGWSEMDEASGGSVK